MTTTWQILDTKRQVETGVIKKVTYQCTAQDGDKIFKKIGHAVLQDISPSLPEFIPFTELIEETVVTWVKAALGTEKTALIEDSTVNKLTLNKDNSELPW